MGQQPRISAQHIQRASSVVELVAWPGCVVVMAAQSRAGSWRPVLASAAIQPSVARTAPASAA